VYLAAPVSAPTAEDMGLNLVNAEIWLEHLVRHTPWAVCAPWLPYVSILDEATHRERGMRDNLAILSRCDAIALVGGRLSPGMKLELDHAVALGLPVIDLLHHGTSPPDPAPQYPTLNARSREVVPA